MAASRRFRPTLPMLLGLPIAAMLAIAIPGTAQAQTYLCPGGPGPGESQIGMASGPGFQGAGVCFANPGETGDDTPLVDPTWQRQVSPETTREKIEQLRQALADLAATRLGMNSDDPGIKLTQMSQDYDNGFWTYSEVTGRRAEPGEHCMVLFTSAEGLVGVFGPGGPYRGAMLKFWGRNLPTPDDTELTQVNLWQDEEAETQTVRGYSYTDPRSGSGVIALAVPSAEAVLATMMDTQRFRLSIDGRQVLDVSWRDGLAARDRLRQCPGSGA
ncbi:hypothetical protein GRI97_15120 [Altererythrobacter xixiisoli]|uniref:Uncharacterized protein n=1 Tax=Croceibacterium xixiisoli TaxID=1476466 RepID=A0A6I4TZ35_9SPHN|nr:hypothetical protein [Croceibacterium xixiisoli]MXP00322.1 hypothetical protein [Croceibacterium xixiisoli]